MKNLDKDFADKFVHRFPNDSWTRVEIFLRAYDRLPSNKGDGITQETLNLFCKNWEEGKIKTVTVDLE